MKYTVISFCLELGLRESSSISQGGGQTHFGKRIGFYQGGGNRARQLSQPSREVGVPNTDSEYLRATSRFNNNRSRRLARLLDSYARWRPLWIIRSLHLRPCTILVCLHPALSPSTNFLTSPSTVICTHIRVAFRHHLAYFSANPHQDRSLR